MPDINNPVTFANTQKTLISNKKKDASFKYSDWGCDELLDLRRHIREHYRVEQRGTCSYCKENISLQSASNSHVEHIVPKSKVIEFIFEAKNLCVVCADCNEIKRELETLKQEENPLKKKYVRYPRSSNAFKIVHPHFDDYDDHIFKLGDIYIDLSVKGSFTILACRLNRKIHKFGIEPSLLSESELFDLMNKFTSEGNFTKRQIIFNRLREYFSKI